MRPNKVPRLPTHPQNKIICIYIHSVALFLAPMDKHRLVYRTRMGFNISLLGGWRLGVTDR